MNKALQEQIERFERNTFSGRFLCGIYSFDAGAANEFRSIIAMAYNDAMERSIKAVREKATYNDPKHGPVPVSIGYLEAEDAIRGELSEDAGLTTKEPDNVP